MRPEPGDDGQDHDEADCFVGPEYQSGEDQEYQRHLQGERQKGGEQEDGQDFAQGPFSNRKAPGGRPRALGERALRPILIRSFVLRGLAPPT